MIALHLGGIPELAMFLGPILLIIAFVKIARRNEATCADDEDDWDNDLGDLRDLRDLADVTKEPADRADADADAVRAAGAGTPPPRADK